MINSDKSTLLPPPADPALVARLGVSNIRSARGLEKLFDSDGKLVPFYVYTGRGPSQGSFHIGHLPGLYLARDLQMQSNRKMYFMLSDDEKALRDGVSLASVTANAQSTVQQLTALGLTSDKVYYRFNSQGMDFRFYDITLRIAASLSPNTVNKVFGEKANIGEMFYPAIQLAPCFAETVREHIPSDIPLRCVVVAGEDQDPFFRLARGEVARRLGLPPPIILYTETVPGFDGSPKMSTRIDLFASPASRPVFLTDSIQEITTAVNNITTVGSGTTSELFKHGADLHRDIPYRVFTIFCKDDKLLEIVTSAYTIGLTDAKDLTILQQYIELPKRLQYNGRQFIGARSMRDLLIKILVSLLYP